MVTIVGIPKPFVGHEGLIQCNAIRSWARLWPVQSIVLLGEPSAVEIAKEVNGTCIPSIPVDEYGTPLFGPAIEAVPLAHDGFICYLNSDIIVLSEFGNVLEALTSRFDRFLAVGRRWNVDVEFEIDFTANWERNIRSIVRERGQLFAPQAIDMFVFRKDCYHSIPAFAIGRSYWDNWMINQARRSAIPVVDVTDALMLVHQNHGYQGFASLRDIRRSPQGRRNFYLAGDNYAFIATVRDATHVCTKELGVREASTVSVSVVIPHLGPINRLRAALTALEHQTYPRTFLDVTVVVNSTSIDTGSLRLDFPYVRFSVETKAGAASARNKGVSISSGEVLAFLDSDCVPDKHWIEHGIQALITGGRPSSFVGGCIQRFVSKHSRRTVAGALDCALFLRQEAYIRDHATCVTANMLVDRQVFMRIGPFDETFPAAAGEDWDWCIRAKSLGIHAVFAPDAVVLHPVLERYAQVKAKLLRIARGNALLARKHELESSSFGRSPHVASFPTWGRLAARCRRLFGDPSLSWSEKIGASACLVVAWPAIRATWRSAYDER